MNNKLGFLAFLRFDNLNFIRWSLSIVFDLKLNKICFFLVENDTYTS